MLRKKEVEFLVAHEVLHVVYDHMDRRGTRDPQLWNIADDYAVNADLKRHKVGEFIRTVPCLYETKYDGKAAEEIYDDLMKNVQKISIDDLLDQMIDDHMDGQDDGEGDGDGNQEGKGKRPKKIDRVKVHYHGTTLDGVVFDSSVDRGTPAEFGVTQVIRGWTEGLQLMKVGSKYKFFIPQELAYGDKPRPGIIKPFMALIFEVELLDIK